MILDKVIAHYAITRIMVCITVCSQQHNSCVVFQHSVAYRSCKHVHIYKYAKPQGCIFSINKTQIPWCMVDEGLWFVLRKVVVSKFITGRNAWPCFLTWGSCI